jgi:hypothetical protein
MAFVSGNILTAAQLNNLSNTTVTTTGVVAANSLTVAGTATITGDLKTAGNELFVDVSTNRVGINDSTPSYSLDVNGDIRATGDIIGDLTGNADTVSTPWSPFSPGTYGIGATGATQTANYAEVGDIVFWEYSIVLGAASSVTGEVRLTMPAAMDDYYKGGMSGDVMFEDADGPDYPGHLFRLNSTTVRLRVSDTAATYTRSTDLAAGIPFTWDDGDSMTAKGWYRKA